jgi:hypothetical protein
VHFDVLRHRTHLYTAFTEQPLGPTTQGSANSSGAPNEAVDRTITSACHRQQARSEGDNARLRPSERKSGLADPRNLATQLDVGLLRHDNLLSRIMTNYLHLACVFLPQSATAFDLTQPGKSAELFPVIQ